MSLDQTLAGVTCHGMLGIATSGVCRVVVVDVFGSREWSRDGPVSGKVSVKMSGIDRFTDHLDKPSDSLLVYLTGP